MGKKRTLIFYGTTGKRLPVDKIGGGERGCLRTIEMYRRLGIDIAIVEKPGLGEGKLTFVKYFFITPFLFIATLVRNRTSPVHIVGFYENQLFYEFMLFLISKCFNRKITYELRNGTMVKTFCCHGYVYQRAMRYMIENADAVLCQGQEYIQFIEQRWKAHTIYYPNYVLDCYLQPYNGEQ